MIEQQSFKIGNNNVDKRRIVIYSQVLIIWKLFHILDNHFFLILNSSENIVKISMCR